MARKKIKEIFELGEELRKVEKLALNTPNKETYTKLIESSEGFALAAPSMEAWLKELVELLPDNLNLLMNILARLERQHPTRDNYMERETVKIGIDKLKDLMKRAELNN